MTDNKPNGFEDTEHRRIALSQWDGEGGAGPNGPQEAPSTAERQPDVPPLSNTELVELHIRVIALENLVITLLAGASDGQIAVAHEIAELISPRPGSTQHLLTIQAAGQMNSLVNRATHFRLKPAA